MSVLTVIYAGQTIHNAEVKSFSFEHNDNGDLFIAAGTREIEPESDGVAIVSSPEPGKTLDPELDPDGRYSAAELAIIRKRQGNADGFDGTR